MKADPQTEREVRELLERMWAAYGRQDLAAALSCYDQEAEVVCIGTGADERCIGLEDFEAALKRDFAQSASAELHMGWCNVSAIGDMAWVAADCRAVVHTREGDVGVSGRYTAVCLRRNGSWSILQSHLSVPADFQAEGESFPRQEG